MLALQKAPSCLDGGDAQRCGVTRPFAPGFAGALEVLAHAELLARRAAAAGGSVELRWWPGRMHVLERHDDPEADSLYSLYQTVFGRAAEINGLSFWFNEAEKGLSMHDIATSFAQSDEFQTTYGVDPSPETLVDGIYANIFGREPDPAGEAFWLDAFQNGLETADFLTAFSDATELHALVENAVDDGIFLIA